MTVDLTRIQPAIPGFGQKKAGTRGWSRHSELAGRPDKNNVSRFRTFQGFSEGLVTPTAHPETLKPCNFKTWTLSTSSRPHREVADLGQDAGHLHPV